MERMNPPKPRYVHTASIFQTTRLRPTEVVAYLRGRGYYPSFERVPRLDYEMSNALEVLTAIGQSRNPRFVIDEDNRFAYENFVRWLHADPTMQAIDPRTGATVPGDLRRGIYLAGPTGSGKSWCLELMLGYAQAWGLKLYKPEPNKEVPLYWRLMRADEVVHEFSREGTIREIAKTRYLGIQDLGQEPPEALYMGNRQNVLAQLIEYRGDQSDYLTFITSNLPMAGERLQKLYGDRVQSRLYEMCNYLTIRGKDRRLGL